ncbi:MAG TPA: hypothetical protein VE244_06060 [Nitrososphaeraceae archaeon]|nr:hypothetical protein [Nitrososphaeraceae archaeon]
MSLIVCRLGLVDNPEGHKDIDGWMDGMGVVGFPPTLVRAPTLS